MICKILKSDSSDIHENVSAVSLPGFKGDFQVLPKHAELFQILKKGKIILEKSGTKSETIEISDGSCHFLGDTLTVIL